VLRVIRSRATLLALFLSFILIRPASVAAGNVVTNGSFNGDYNGWTLSAGATVSVAYDPSGYSGTINGIPSAGGSVTLSTPVGRNETATGYLYQTVDITAPGSTVMLYFAWREGYAATTPATVDVSVVIKRLSDSQTTTAWSESVAPGSQSTWSVEGEGSGVGSPSVIDLSSFMSQTGQYEIQLTVNLKNGNNKNAQTFVWFDEIQLDVSSNDTTPPVVTWQSTSPGAISPANGDGTNDSTVVTYDIDEDATVKLVVKDSGSTIVYETSPPEAVTAGTNRTISWDGSQNYGGKSGWAPEGTYSLEIVATDGSNNTTDPPVAVGSVVVDNTAPLVNSGPSATNIGSTSATITWGTDEAATSQVEYRPLGEQSWTATAEDPTLVTNHSVNLTGLNSSATYEYRVLSKDEAGNQVVSGIYQFTTAEADLTPPTVSSTSPVDGATGVLRGTDITVTFSELMDPATVDLSSPQTFIVQQGAMTVSGTLDKSNNPTFVFTPSTYLDPNTTYTVTIKSGAGGVKDQAGNALQSDYVFSFTTGSNVYESPHGGFTTNSQTCATCHSMHSGAAANILGQSSVDSLCYLCHDAGGTGSIYTVQTEFEGGGVLTKHPVPTTINCNQCHNPHDGGAVHYPRLLETSTGAHGGNDFCWTCHGTGSALPDPNGDHQTYYPTDGTGHDDAFLNPPSGTGVKCSKCHEEHGSPIPKLLRTDPNPGEADARDDGSAVSGNNESFCYECHDGPGSRSDNAWDGKSINEAKGHGFDCAQCHDPHGTANPRYLLNSYDIAYSESRSENYTASDYQACFTGGCHDSAALTDTSDVTNTGFNNGEMNLHWLHLVNNNIVCKECHRPHGAIPSENPAQAHRVGFPADTVTASIAAGTGPLFTHDPGGTSGGSCTLTCHGVDHDGSATYTYDNGGAGGTEPGGPTDCSGCHGELTNSLLQTESPNTHFKHPIKDAAGTYDAVANGGATCLSFCHVDHGIFKDNGRAKNLRKVGGSTSTPPTLADATDTDFDVGDITNGGLCLSCHKDPQDDTAYTQPDGTTGTRALSISDYGGSAHNYEVLSEPFSDSSTFRANCSKCHNDTLTKQYQSGADEDRKFGLHGSLLESFKALLGDTTASVANPYEEQFCYKCHDTGTGADFYGVSMSNPNADSIGAEFQKASRHTVDDATQTRGPVECIDCHDAHGAKAGTRVTPTGLNTSSVSGPLIGAKGVKVTTWQPPGDPAPDSETLWSPPDASGYTEVTITASSDPLEVSYVCLKCHSSYAPSLPAGTTDKAAQFNPYNYSVHPVFGFSQNGTGNPFIASDPSLMKPPWDTMNPRLMTCIDCHNAPTGSNGPFGVHGSDNPYMLRDYGSPRETGAQPTNVYDKLCLLCHADDYDYGGGGGGWRHSSNAAHFYQDDGPNVLGCAGCHGGPAGYAAVGPGTVNPNATSTGGRLGAIHGVNFRWKNPDGSDSPALAFLVGGYLSGIQYDSPGSGTCWGQMAVPPASSDGCSAMGSRGKGW